MKKILFLSLIALSALSANAQTEKEAAAAAKQAAKEMKAKKAADLKAFKEKQKAELAAFIEAQNAPVKPVGLMPELVTKEDTVAALFGAYQSNGLKQYMSVQLGVDTTYMTEFVNGVMENIKSEGESEPVDPGKKAYNAGKQIADQIASITANLSKDYFAAEPEKTLDAKIIAGSIAASLMGNNIYTTDDASKQFNDIMTQRQAENKEKMYGAWRDENKQWLDNNKSKEGVTVLPSGLQYKVITAGNGDKPKASDKVKVHYAGSLIDGTEFDSSYKRGKEASFGVTQVIKGWTEALQLMPVGSKWELYIPYQLGYGENGSGSQIKPYSTLVFTVELIDIESKEEAKPATSEKGTKSVAKTSAKKK